MEGLFTAEDGKTRCFWCKGSELYMNYHDNEWGKPVHDDIRLFEKITLEGFQAGLSWITVLKKRENFRAAFAGFDFNKLSLFTEEDVEILLQNKGIIRHRKKIESAINNAKRAIEMIEEFGSIKDYLWQFKQDESTRPTVFTYEELMKITQTAESKALSKDLKKRGWSFVGPTTMYAMMQAMGMVNDHIEGCEFRHV